jgi:hypothetical protein
MASPARMTFRHSEGVAITARPCQYAATMAPPLRKGTMTVIRDTWRAALVSSRRGRLVTRTAATREQAIAIGRRLLHDVAADMVWLHGERIFVEIEAAVRHKEAPIKLGWGEGRSGSRRVALDSASQFVCPNTDIVGLLQ